MIPRRRPHEESSCSNVLAFILHRPHRERGALKQTRADPGVRSLCFDILNGESSFGLGQDVGLRIIIITSLFN